MVTLTSYSNQAEKLERALWNHSELEQIAIVAMGLRSELEGTETEK